MLIRASAPGTERGLTMVEVLVTIVILAFGLLGLAGLQSKIQVGSIEAYQRAQAIVLLSDMVERINANKSQAASYVLTGTLGTSDPDADCTTLAAGAARDKCEWSLALKGAAEQKGTSKTGAMTNARGCITQVQAPNASAGVCKPGIYLVSVAWQGMHATVAPGVACGQGLYGTDDTYRRAISARVSVALLNCY